MPELPDIELYLAALRPRLLGERLVRVRLGSPFVLRSVQPPIATAEGREVVGLRRLGKRIVLALAGDLFLVLHLMVSGRLKWRDLATGPLAIPRKNGLLAFDFTSGTLLLTEASTKKRASLHLVAGEAALTEHDRGGHEVLGASDQALRDALHGETHTLKRALTDPRILSGIGNAYSDEILHRARLSPFKRTTDLQPDEEARLFVAIRDVLREWLERLRAETGDAFPEKVTAFRPQMAVHGRYGQPCPVCGTPVQRILYADNEANYCPTCQTGGRLLADRVLSQLLKKDWPKTLEDLEERKERGRA
jgi:formamidopyrimidine-DNA glycosylase